jgi:hypothetical protein
MPTALTVGVDLASGTSRGGAGGQSLGSATTVAQNTTATNDMAGDGYTWAPGGPLVVDQYGKLFAWAQRVNGGSIRHVPVVSGDAGATWSEPTRTSFFDAAGEGFLIRGATVYDATHDRFHVCWVLTQTDGAVVYRCYTPTRDGSNNITGVTRTRGFQPEVGVAGMTFEAPVALWCADIGKLVIGWTAKTAAKAEYRLTMRTVSDDAGDTTGANWVAPFNENAGAGATDTLASSGLVKYSCPAKSASSADIFLALCRKSAGAASHAKDLCWVHVTGGNTGSLRFNRATWSAANTDWRGGLGAAIANDTGLTTVSAIKRAGTDAGYSLKFQLLSKLVEDTVNDKLWVSCSTWKDDTAGDTWSLWSVSAADAASSAIDVYAAGSANTDAGRDMFVTGDVMFDATSGYAVVSYTNLPVHDTFLSTYANGVAVQTGFVAYSATPCDIPTLYDVRIAGKIGILFRDFNAGAESNPPSYVPPYHGLYVSVALA